jgi:pimeloyl-ACP methyl ester carboxylesterase
MTLRRGGEATAIDEVLTANRDLVTGKGISAREAIDAAIDSDYRWGAARMSVKGACSILWLFACAAFGAAGGPEIEVLPSSGLMDAPFHVVLEKVLPGSRVRIEARRDDAKGRSWTAIGEYLADADGRIDTNIAPSLSGSYEGVSPHGLWCSALPVSPDKLDGYLAELPKHPELPTRPDLDVGAVYTVHLSAIIDGTTVAATTATRTYAAGLRPEEIASGRRVRGVFFPVPSSTVPGVPIIVLAGSGGGVPQTQAALFASHGHPALAQGIFGYKDLPSSLDHIPLEMFHEAAQWLKDRTGAQRVAILGNSRGSEAAGLAASYYPDDFSAAIVYEPSHLSNGAIGPGITTAEPAWTFQGNGIAADQGETDSNNDGDNSPATRAPPGAVGTPFYLKTWSDPKVAETFGIPFERMRGPLLAIAGGADEMWPSFIGAEQIRRRLAIHGRAHLVDVAIYPGVGHSLSWVGTGGALSTFVFHPVAKGFYAMGGLPNANCEAPYDAWEKALLFLDRVRPPQGLKP